MTQTQQKKQVEIRTKRIFLHSETIQKIESIVGYRLTRNVEQDILKAIKIGGENNFD